MRISPVNKGDANSPIIAVAGGGTGGHLYPALAIAEALHRRLPQVQFVFYGTDRPIDRQVLGGLDCGFVAQHLPPVRSKPWTWPGTIRGLHRSSVDCRKRFSDQQHVVVLGTGGLASVAPIREARRAGIPAVLLNPDAIPGRANRLLASIADVVFVQWPDAVKYLHRARRVQVSGCGVRSEFNIATREQGIKSFGLDPGRKTLLITGASQGARTVNQAVAANIDWLEERGDWQVLHLTGQADYEMVRTAYEGSSCRVKVHAYTDLMAEALAAADLVVARAGASTLAEISAVGRASILMPYPFHRDMHQLANARCLVRCSAARIVDDKIDPVLNAPALRDALDALMKDDEARKSMAAAARRTGQGQAADRIASQILELAQQRGRLDGVEYLEPVFQ